MEDRSVPLTSRAGPRESRFGRLALTTLVATLSLVAVGGLTRGSGSGYGCEDRWPLCEDGALGGLLPRAEYHMVVEWTHRWVAAIVGLLALALAWSAWRHHRHDRRIVVPAVAAVGVIGFQAWIGRMVVAEDLDADLVALHLATAMIVVALLTAVLVHALPRWDAPPPGRAWVAWVGAGALSAYALLILGSMVHNEYVGGWPLVGDELVPDLESRTVAIHFFHRLAAAGVLVFLAALAVAARRRRRPRGETRLLDVALAGILVNVGLGAAHVFTEVTSSALVITHLAVASVVWAALVAATLLARRAEVDTPAGGPDRRAAAVADVPAPSA
ncbi:MAG: COX15/CtaA family protein [Acidimicrobiia bacterium]|nr:COX15/CtaA family protein [Acidimicrobiia bacterium]